MEQYHVEIHGSLIHILAAMNDDEAMRCNLHLANEYSHFFSFC